MKISDRVYLVGSGKYGMELSHSTDCNVYLLDGGGEYALIDAGGGVEPERIVQNIESHGIAMKDVAHLLLTHVHGDHAAGAQYFHHRYGLNVVVSAEAAPWLEQGDMNKTSLTHAIRGGVYPADFSFQACPVSRRVQEHDLIRIGHMELTVYETPGHSRGHVSYLWEQDGRRSLFSGDVVFAGGKVVIQYIWDCSIPEYADSMAKLHSLGLHRLYPGHGPFLLANAAKHIETAHRYFTRLEVPPNF
ncbi:hypothetical protein SD70_14060 [Gordoniibacillus kamchatkensis]|uniref:Metallo-beta-lactamase domain-containing protein n=1 Tax=Gordoniibacillus kamchatkensis TaxID=1590651 RepID=A0ABR5AH48_9BACL|nr:MBL fold metallo-hydrolase [Paenibacillus sp. VKM B-2647]KIL40361.1 hypothetical protein SD70_14060 [Paenibacillus sp. VKM B-2647]